MTKYTGKLYADPVSLYFKVRKFYYGIISISPHINPCPSCPYKDCEGKKKIGTGIKNEIVGCSKWP